METGSGSSETRLRPLEEMGMLGSPMDAKGVGIRGQSRWKSSPGRGFLLCEWQ